ncbi:MAG: hypothetical protein KDH88_01835 [Chromatiales bacterium]|nr:hypothetical protein [Chromatiales bacterium]
MKTFSFVKLAAFGLSASLALAGCAGNINNRGSVERADVNQQIYVEYGEVLDVGRVQVESSYGTGAAIGGIGGALAAGGGGRNTVALGLAGALIGALTENALTSGESAESFTIRKNNGQTVKVITQNPDIFVGDCVSIDNLPREVVLGRVAPRFCR